MSEDCKIVAIICGVTQGLTVTVWLRSSAGDELLADRSVATMGEAEAAANHWAVQTRVPLHKVEFIHKP
jgi:hypothetical protein